MIALFIIGVIIFLLGLLLLAAMCVAGANEDREIQRLMEERKKENKESGKNEQSGKA